MPDLKLYRKFCLLGTLGALLMLVGDLCLSVVPAHEGDSGLFARQAYFDGLYGANRFPLLLVTGLCGMALCSFAVRAIHTQILPECGKTRAAIKVSGIIYLTSAGVIHFMIGSLADWISRLTPIVGKEEALNLVMEQYNRLMPCFPLAYAGMIALILVSAFASLTKRTFLPRKLFVFHMLVWQLVFVMIPDIRQALGMKISTWDFVLSQGSGNASLLIFMISNAVWAFRADRNPRRE